MTFLDAGNGAASYGVVALAFAVFCAYWAQETDRSAWLWFFLGALLPPIAAIALPSKNAVRRERMRGTRSETTSR